MEIQVDATDRKILSLLVKDARKPFLEIARECGVSGAAIHQRVKRLENAGIITGSRLLVKPEALGLQICAFIQISLSEANKYAVVIEALNKIPEVVECHFITGRYALLVKMYCLSNEHLMDLVINKLQQIPHIQNTETLMSLHQPIERQIWVNEFQTPEFNITGKKNNSKKYENQLSKRSDSKKKAGK